MNRKICNESRTKNNFSHSHGTYIRWEFRKRFQLMECNISFDLFRAFDYIDSIVKFDFFYPYMTWFPELLHTRFWATISYNNLDYVDLCHVICVKHLIRSKEVSLFVLWKKRFSSCVHNMFELPLNISIMMMTANILSSNENYKYQQY